MRALTYVLHRLTTGAKAPYYFQRVTARLKPCPDTNRSQNAAAEAVPLQNHFYLDCHGTSEVAGSSLRSTLRVKPVSASFPHCLRLNQRALPFRLSSVACGVVWIATS